MAAGMMSFNLTDSYGSKLETFWLSLFQNVSKCIILLNMVFKMHRIGGNCLFFSCLGVF